VDSKVGYLTRNGLYKALALTALAQQGKPLNEKILEAYTDQGNGFIVAEVKLLHGEKQFGIKFLF
jgi:hypothetical protein